MALGRLGEPRISSLSEENKTAQQCAIYYPVVRDELFESGIWDFATKRAELSQVATAPDFGYDYQYELPGDYIRLLDFNGAEIDQERELFDIEGNRLLTDADTASIRYIYRNESTADYSPLFVQAFALKLAAELSVTLTGSRNEKVALLQEYENLALPKARTIDANKSRGRRRDQVYGESEVVRRRRAGGTGSDVFFSFLK